MSYLIGITGKGGVGKTTLAALLTILSIRRGWRPVLAVDADPNTCLDAALGVIAKKTVGGIREEAREIAGKGMLSGISKQELLGLKIGEDIELRVAGFGDVEIIPVLAAPEKTLLPRDALQIRNIDLPFVKSSISLKWHNGKGWRRWEKWVPCLPTKSGILWPALA